MNNGDGGTTSDDKADDMDSDTCKETSEAMPTQRDDKLDETCKEAKTTAAVDDKADDTCNVMQDDVTPDDDSKETEGGVTKVLEESTSKKSDVTITTVDLVTLETRDQKKDTCTEINVPLASKTCPGTNSTSLREVVDENRQKIEIQSEAAALDTPSLVAISEEPDVREVQEEMQPPVLSPQIVIDLNFERTDDRMSEKLYTLEPGPDKKLNCEEDDGMDKSDTSSEESVEIRIEESEIILGKEEKEEIEKMDTEENLEPNIQIQEAAEEEVIITTTTDNDHENGNLVDSVTEISCQDTKEEFAPFQRNTRQRVLRLKTASQKSVSVTKELQNTDTLHDGKTKGSVPQVILTIKQEKEETEDDDDDEDDDEDEEEEDSSGLLVDVKSEDLGGSRPVRPVERQKMRPWMVELLDKGNIPGLSWQNRRDRIFRISWKHAAHNCFNRDRDSDLFERWAVHTGRHYEGNHKRWKANFRCALNSLPDVIELRDLGVRKGDNAFKVYKFLDTNDPVYKDRIDNKGKRTSSSYSRSSVGKYESKNVKSEDIPEIQVAEGGTLHTLLHAIELQQQGIVTEKPSETKKTGKRSSEKSSSHSSSEAKKPKKEDGETKMGKVSLVQLNKHENQSEGNPKSGDETGNTVTPQQGDVGMVIPPGTGFITFGKGSEQKIVLPVNKTGLESAAATLSIPAMNIINKSQEPKITIPLSQLAAVIAQTQQQQTSKSGVPGNVELKPLEGLTTLQTQQGLTLATKPTTMGLLTPAALTNLPVMSSLQQGHGQFMTFATGVTQGQGQMSANLANPSVTRTQPITKVSEQKIPSTVLEALDSPGSSVKCKPDTVASLQKSVISQIGRPLLSPTKHTVNKDITSLAAALKVRPPGQASQIRPVFPTPVNVNAMVKSGSANIVPPTRSIESQGVRNKLVTRLLISGAATTNTTTQATLPLSPSIPQLAPSQPRPSLDLVIKSTPQVALTTPSIQPPLQNLKPPAMPSILIGSNGEQIQFVSSQYPTTTDCGVVNAVSQSEKVVLNSTSPAGKMEPPTPAPQVATPHVAVTARESAPSEPTSSSKHCPEFLEQVTIDLREMQDGSKENPESSQSPAQEYAYSCLWCKIDFSKKIDLLQHFMNLHQDMLMVPGESETAQGHLTSEGQTLTHQGQGQSPTEDALDLRTGQKEDNRDAVRVEVVPYSEIIDMSCTRKRKKPKTVKEALIRKKKGNLCNENKQSESAVKTVKVSADTGTVEVDVKKRRRAKSKMNKNADRLSVDSNSGLGDGTVSGQATPGSLSETDSKRPKYSLTSLIEALRESIERDKGKASSVLPDGMNNEDEESKETELEESHGDDICYDDLSSSTPDDEDVDDGDDENEDEDDILEVEGMNTGTGASEDSNVQVSVKTFQVDGKTMYKCSVCAKVFSKTCTFARHAMVHSKMYPYQCGLCDEKCSDMRVLLRHLDWHGENVDCPCKKCERLHKGNPDKKDNTGNTDGVSTSKFFCEICGREFQSDVACKAHVNMHKRGDNLVCEICHLTFYCNRVLSKHRKSAHGVQFCPYCLETCHLDMASHMSEHTGVYMYRCGLCGDGYNSRPLLHEHLKIHTHLGKEFSQDRKDAIAESLSKKGSAALGKQGEKTNGGAVKTLNKKVKKRLTKGVKNKTVISQKTTEKPKLIHTGDSLNKTAEGQVGKKNPARTMKRKCRWHDNDSVCERCDISFVKKIAFGRKPKSKTGKESPRPSESGNLDSFSMEGDSMKCKLGSTDSPVKVVINDHDYGTDVAQIASM